MVIRVVIKEKFSCGHAATHTEDHNPGWSLGSWFTNGNGFKCLNCPKCKKPFSKVKLSLKVLARSQKEIDKLSKKPEKKPKSTTKEVVPPLPPSP